ncbi:MAG TPA: murein biosynthesis integral membrane protein MurJ, partial [Thermomicrobiales bacterium]|nr:murein biosynthesis integral membrane protein MurJ [Thermomicrobiales bacterium]
MSQPGRPDPDGTGYDIQETQAFDIVERSGRAGDTAPLPIVPTVEHLPPRRPRVGQVVRDRPRTPHITEPLDEPLVVKPTTGRTAAENISQGIAFAAVMLMIGNILSRILGLVREQVAAGFFGTGNEIAAFTIADNIHTMLFDLVISGMMQAALIPILSEYTAPEKRDELRRITGALLVLSGIVVGSVVVFLMIFAPAAVRVMTSLGGGEEARGADTFALTVELTRWILPAVLLLAFSTILMSTLYAMQRFARPALSLSLRNVAIVASTVALGWTAFGVRSMALGIVIGALLLILIQLPGLRDAMPKLNFNFGHPAIRRIGILYVPIFIGLFANTVALIVDRNLAWGVDNVHALGAMRYATTLNQMVLGLVAAAISLASLPALSRYWSAGDIGNYWATLMRGLRMITVLAIPATLGLLVLSWPVVKLLFEHGATGHDGATQILIALLIYLPGTLFAAYDQVLIFAYFARQNTRTPQIVGVLSVGVYFLFALPLVGRFEMAGLVAANSAQFIFHTIVMIVLIRKLRTEEVSVHINSRLLRTIGICTGVGLVMAAVAGGLAWLLSTGLPDGGTLGQLLKESLVVIIPAGAGAAIYAAGLLAFRVEEMQTI